MSWGVISLLIVATKIQSLVRLKQWRSIIWGNLFKRLCFIGSYILLCLETCTHSDYRSREEALRRYKNHVTIFHASFHIWNYSPPLILYLEPLSRIFRCRNMKPALRATTRVFSSTLRIGVEVREQKTLRRWMREKNTGLLQPALQGYRCHNAAKEEPGYCSRYSDCLQAGRSSSHGMGDIILLSTSFKPVQRLTLPSKGYLGLFPCE
jgi:hypothetical protein